MHVLLDKKLDAKKLVRSTRSARVTTILPNTSENIGLLGALTLLLTATSSKREKTRTMANTNNFTISCDSRKKL